MNALYNEFEPFAAAWLRELIKAGAIADGEVSEKDMRDVVPSELMGFNQVHLCAGIGGWSAALRLAGWPDNRPVWTVSLPCQPFSAAGQGKGFVDERGQLADAFFWLAGICRPHVIFGEQVEAAIKHDWWDVMASQLESIGYTVGAVAFPASSVGAFHLRQRLYWVAHTEGNGRRQNWKSIKLKRLPACGLADAEHSERREEGNRRNDFDSEEAGRKQGASLPGERGSTGIVADASDNGHANSNGIRETLKPSIKAESECEWEPTGSCHTGIVGDSGEQGLQERLQPGRMAAGRSRTAVEPGGQANFWSDAEWIPCRDGKVRPIPNATESIFQFTSNGFSCIMGDSWGSTIENLKKWVMDYARKTKEDAGKVLRTMWCEAGKEAIRENAGGYDTVQEPSLLLIALCQLAWTMGKEQDGLSQDFPEICERTMRIMRMPGTPSCPPQGLELEEQRTGKSDNSLHFLPYENSQPEEGQEMFILRNEIQKIRNVPEAFSEMEKIWRSVLDEGAKNGMLKRFRSDKSAIVASIGFPLAHGVRNRVGTLRGAGNAIVPAQAAEFIKAFMAIEGR